MKILGKDVKGVLKILVILLLVAGVIAGTCYLFFKYLRDKEDSYTRLTDYAYNVEREEFLSKINFMNSTIYGKNATDTRFTILKDTYDSLDQIITTNTSYLMTTKVEDSKIVRALDEVVKLEQKCDAAMDEFFTKAEDVNFKANIDKGANDAYKYLAEYLISYAKLMQVVNSEIARNVEYRDSDIKFSVIDVYLNVVINTYSDLDYKAGDGIIRLKDNFNIKVFTTNNILNFNKTNLVLAPATHYEYVYDFIKNYNSCDHTEFAKNLSGASTFTDYSESYTTIERAYYYFNQLFVAVGG